MESITSAAKSTPFSIKDILTNGTVQYLKQHKNNNNNNNNYEQSENERDFKHKRVWSERRGSLDCFLIDKNQNNNDGGHSDIERMQVDEQRSSNPHHLKMGFYSFPLVVETPLDMRRCTNDSGECSTFLFPLND